MVHKRGAAVYRLASTHDIGAARHTDRLMPQAHAKDRNVAPQVAHDINADTGFIRRTRAWRQDDGGRRFRLNLVNRDCIVTHNPRSAA